MRAVITTAPRVGTPSGEMSKNFCRIPALLNLLGKLYQNSPCPGISLF
jgi:hypothetical protein